MRKIFLLLVVLMLVAPALARVDVTLTQVGKTNEVIVSFDATSEPNRVRAFSLDLRALSAKKILSIVPGSYFIGESADSNGYGIFPGSIDINDTSGEVDSNGTPDCNGNDYDGTLSGLDSNGVTFEMGSLYVGAANAPGKSGVLFKILVEDGENYTVDVNENAIRGGIVMEDPNEQVDVNLTPVALNFDCFPSDHDDFANWVAAGKPDCWCYDRQCHGDADDTSDGHEDPLVERWVIMADYSILVAGWQKKRSESTATPFSEYICADFGHDNDGHEDDLVKRWVTMDDYSILVGNWQKKVSEAGANVDPNCLTWSGFFP
jgi:hypothetical protein